MIFSVYVLECSDQSLYTGYTNNLENRIKLHSQGKASRYTRSRRPVKLVASWRFQSKKEAMRFEAAFKQLSRAEKLHKIAGNEL